MEEDGGVVKRGTGGFEADFLNEGGGGGGIAFRSRSVGGDSCMICGISAFSPRDSSSL